MPPTPPQTLDKIHELEQKIDKMYVSVEKLRRYFQITMWITIVLFVLPLVGIVFAIPTFLATFSQIAEIGNVGM
jgi:hypothetical protein